MLTGCTPPPLDEAHVPGPPSVPERGAAGKPSPLTASLLVPPKPRLLNSPRHEEVTLVVFIDYQCPYCSQMNGLLRQAIQDYGQSLRVVVRNLPLPFHRYAESSARAIEAAAEQGALEPMMDMVLSSQGEWANASSDPSAVFERYALELGLDIPQFTSDFYSAVTSERIRKDVRDAKAFGAKGTPSVFLNGELIATNSNDYQTLQKPLIQALSEAGPPPTSTR